MVIFMGNLAEQIGYTYKDYITWTGKIRYEIIDGVAYAMASPSQEHQEISGELHGRLWQFLRGKTCKVFHAPFDVRLNFNSFDNIVVQPDLLVVCDKSKLNGSSVKGAPDLIIEILSPSNTRHDTDLKFKLYQRAGVREYWIVDPKYYTVQVYILKNGKYGVGSAYTDDTVIPVHVLEGCEINLADVFYDTLESEFDENEAREESVKRKIIDAMKNYGISDEQIEKIIDEADNDNGDNAE